MTFTFSPTLPIDFKSKPLVITGLHSLQLPNCEYLAIEHENFDQIFEIKYKDHCSPFKQAAIVDHLLLVGHEGQFYLYDLNVQQHLLTIEMDGYFGHFYVYQNCFYVADCSSLHCLNNKGQIIWRSSNLGIDGVTVQSFTNDKIYGSGEWDPPGGWQDFVLKLKTGEEIKEKI